MRVHPLLILSLFCLLFQACDEARTATPQAAAPAADRGVPDLPADISFNEHIQPILSEYCYHCHGPDSGTREPKDLPLRLDRPQDALAKRGDHPPVIIPGKPAESELIRLIRSTDPEVIMPPPSSHKILGAREIALLEKWIEQGARYEPHWSFGPLHKPEAPAAGEGWAENPVDRFIADTMQRSGLKPNPPENLRRFHRRLTLDLTGLPPSPGETDAFEKACAAGGSAAVTAEVDRLLATTASAEHFARQWLDAARYADTHGIHIDNYRAIWPYRDWVVRAFQQNMPWDQFTLEQIAGDLLPDRTLDQWVATGFSRCLATTGEGGAIPEEYDAVYAKDRVETVSAVWLGLTTGCAACHDHKFDPISMKEFYQLAAFFRNTSMTAMDGNNAEHKPNVFVPLPEDRAEWDRLEKAILDVDKELAERGRQANADWEKWQADPQFHFGNEIDSSLEVALPFHDAEGPLRGQVKQQAVEWAGEVERVDGPLGKAPVISERATDLGDIGTFSRQDQITLGGFFRMEGQTAGTLIGRADPAHNLRGWELSLDNAKPVFLVCDSWDKSATRLVAGRQLETGKWHHIMVTFDGKVASHQVVTMYIDGKRVASGPDPNTVGGSIESKVPLRLGARHGEKSRFNARVAMQDFRFYRRLLTPEEIAELPEKSRYRQIASTPAGQRRPEQTEVLRKYYLTKVDAPSLEILKRRDQIESARQAIRARGSVSLVMDEKPTEPFAHILNRGVYSDKGEKVAPGTPAVLPPMPPGAPNNRLGLARWLNDPANPLPARVTVNRAWHSFFGTGIVETSEDFGIMGTRPSHPKLLDWLAAEFIGSGWNHRHIVKLIVTSATYRQSGKVSPEKLEKDPFNRLLARGPRNRLDAEPIRDLALAASQLLSAKTGGPPVKPYQPEGIWEAVAMPQSNTKNYKPDTGEALYRRSIYTFWKRSAAPPTMEIFNAPTREVFCVRRDRTNTPLQALALMNDPQFLEAARALAAHALVSAPSPDGRIDHITLRLISRRLDDDERRVILECLEEFHVMFRGDSEAAAKLIHTGASAPPSGLDPAELASWTMLASQILNLDETITR